MDPYGDHMRIFLLAIWAFISSWERMGLGLAAVLTLWGVVIGYVIRYHMHWIDIRFSRALGTTEISRCGVLYQHKDKYKLEHFLEARLDESTTNDGTTYRVMLLFLQDMADALQPETRDAREKLRRQLIRGWRDNGPIISPLCGGRKIGR